MLLAVNVGNTETKLGVFRDRELSFSRRIGTHPERTADELALLFGGFLEQEQLSFSRQITVVAISSVVPSMTQSLRDMTERYFHFDPVVVGPGVKTAMAVPTDNPREVDGIVERSQKELGPATVVATGGLAGVVMPHCTSIDHHDQWLTLEGLRLVFERNTGPDA